MKIFTYFEPLSNAGPLLDYWYSVWTDRGFEPVFLSLGNARAHPKFDVFSKKIGTLPTVNNVEYERACYLRWLAFAQVGGIFSEYDVFPFDDLPVKLTDLGLINYNQHRSPGFITGLVGAAERVVEAILAYVPRPEDVTFGRQHVSDMIIMQNSPDLFVEIFDATKTYTHDGWETAPLIHFANAYIPKGQSRLTLIKELYERRKH